MSDYTCLPDIEIAKLLVGIPWKKVEVPGGRLMHPSKSIPGAWSVSSLLVRGDTDVLVFTETYVVGSEERYGLRFTLSNDDWSRSHVESARPRFSEVLQWPSDVEFPTDFIRTGPTTAEFGLGRALQISQGDNSGSVVPVFWYFLRTGTLGLLLFADGEIPLNVGICGARSASVVRQSIPTVSIVAA